MRKTELNVIDMNRLLNIALLAITTTLLVGCAKDNYDPPKSTLEGRITYQGIPLNLRGTGAAIQLQLYQDGYDYKTPITVVAGQEGEFSALLFDGEYKMVTRSGNGPWIDSRDTTIINIKGYHSLDVEVIPYYTLSDVDLTMPDANTFSAKFNINKIVENAGINQVMLLLSKTQFVDDVNNIYRLNLTGISEGRVDIDADLANNTNVADAKALFARVGVYPTGADQAIYSPVIRLK